MTGALINANRTSSSLVPIATRAAGLERARPTTNCAATPQPEAIAALTSETVSKTAPPGCARGPSGSAVSNPVNRLGVRPELPICALLRPFSRWRGDVIIGCSAWAALGRLRERRRSDYVCRYRAVSRLRQTPASGGPSGLPTLPACGLAPALTDGPSIFSRLVSGSSCETAAGCSEDDRPTSAVLSAWDQRRAGRSKCCSE